MAINLAKLIYPYFVVSGLNKKEKINSFPGVFRFSVDRLLKEIEEIDSLGLKKVLLFGVPRHKDSLGSAAYAQDSIVGLATKRLKENFPDLTVITDVCLCAYTNHGHCGILKTGKTKIDNRATLAALAKIALRYAEAGADWVAPSAMASGQVAAIRLALDRQGFAKTRILGYSAKFNSNFYGPFRNAADSAPTFGDRSAYQLDYTDAQEALEKIEEDIVAHADMVMVKPALGYLDIIKTVKQEFNYPLAAYNVSGEYTLVKLGAARKIWDEKKAVREILASISRAGADYIITYHAKDIARWMRKENYTI